MTVIKNHFDYLYFTECKFGKPLLPLSYTQKIIKGRSIKRTRGFARRNINKLENSGISKNELIIPTEKLGILPGHPLNSTDKTIYIQKCKLIFKNLKNFKMKLTPYMNSSLKRLKISKFPNHQNRVYLARDPRKKRTFIYENSENTITESTALFELEGVYKNPLAWIDWTIESVSFELETPSDIQPLQVQLTVQ